MKTKEQMLKESIEKSKKRMCWPGWFDNEDILELMEQYAKQQINLNLGNVSGSLISTINTNTLESGKTYKAVLIGDKDVIIINDKNRKEHFSRHHFE